MTGHRRTAMREEQLARAARGLDRHRRDGRRSRVPATTTTTTPAADRLTVAGVLSESGLVFAGTFAAALVVGAVLALAAGAWWPLLLALALDAVGTAGVVAIVLNLPTEHGSRPRPS